MLSGICIGRYFRPRKILIHHFETSSTSSFHESNLITKINEFFPLLCDDLFVNPSKYPKKLRFTVCQMIRARTWRPGLPSWCGDGAASDSAWPNFRRHSANCRPQPPVRQGICRSHCSLRFLVLHWIRTPPAGYLWV